ncbi:hypothetical protein N7504_001383 [Penicillium tannophilum]|nr:hypothetical protein N7504_001383 [Penicillium tannophilum]
MKISAAIITSALVASATAFDKWQRTYLTPLQSNSFQTTDKPKQHGENESPITLLSPPGQTVSLHFNRAPTTHCPDPLANYPTGTYGVWLYNNPVRDRDTISFAQSIKIEQGINATCGHIYVKIPAKLPAVQHGDLWYLRLDTYLETAPQMPTVYNAAGPFSISA